MSSDADSPRQQRGQSQPQRGFALLLVLLVLTVGGVGLFLAAQPSGGAEREAEQQDQLASLRDMSDAVIANALLASNTDGDQLRPGALVCPDNNAAGDDQYGVASSLSCINETGDVETGRLPHRTLGVARDEHDLWYAIDVNLHNEPGNTINPDSGADGGITIDGAGNYAAVGIAPRAPRNDQTDRPSAVASDYLEGDNADGDLEFHDCAERTACNDRVRGITIDELFDKVQERVLAGIVSLLESYHDEHGALPRAAPFNGAARCDPGAYLGRLPVESGKGAKGTTSGGCNDDEHLGDELADLPDWIQANDWLDFVVYRVDRECTADGSGDCGATTLELDGEGGYAAIVAAAGRTMAGQDRKTTNPDVADYLDQTPNDDPETTEYRDHPLGSGDNDVFVGVELP